MKVIVENVEAGWVLVDARTVEERMRSVQDRMKDLARSLGAKSKVG